VSVKNRCFCKHFLQNETWQRKIIVKKVKKKEEKLFFSSKSGKQQTATLSKFFLSCHNDISHAIVLAAKKKRKFSFKLKKTSWFSLMLSSRLHL